MDLSQALKQHYAGTEADTEQVRLKRMYEAQQTQMGQACLQVQKELVDKLRSKGINASLQEVACMVNVKTGKQSFYMKG